MIKYLRSLYARFQCRRRGHRYNPITTYMTHEVGDGRYTGQIKLVCKHCKKATLTNASFLVRDKHHIMEWDIPQD